MKIGDLLVVYVPTEKTHAPNLLEAALPGHLTLARGVVREVVPDVVPAGEDGEAIIVRVEDIIAFRAKLVPVRESKTATIDIEPCVLGSLLPEIPTLPERAPAA